MDCLDDTFTEMDLDLMDEVEPAAVKPRLLIGEAKKRRRSKSAKKAASPPDNEENLTVKRNVANSQERRRMRRLNTALDELRKCIPQHFHLYHRRLSKIKTLRLAISYIATLGDLLNCECGAHKGYLHRKALGLEQGQGLRAKCETAECESNATASIRDDEDDNGVADDDDEEEDAFHGMYSPQLHDDESDMHPMTLKTGLQQNGMNSEGDMSPDFHPLAGERLSSPLHSPPMPHPHPGYNPCPGSSPIALDLSYRASLQGYQINSPTTCTTQSSSSQLSSSSASSCAGYFYPPTGPALSVPPVDMRSGPATYRQYRHHHQPRHHLGAPQWQVKC